MLHILILFILWAGEILALPGLEYRHLEREGPQSIHVLIVDPEQWQIVPFRAQDNGLGRETVPSLVKRKGAAAGINGGFFKIDEVFDGLPSSILKIQGQWYGLPKKLRGAVGWSDEGKKVLIDRVFATAEVFIGGREIPIDGLNRPRQKGEKILFLPCFNWRTLTKRCQEVVVRQGLVEEVGKGDHLIPYDGWVVSADKWEVEKNQTASYRISVPDEWASLEHIVGGTPLLIQNGRVIEDFSPEQTYKSFLTQRHARTAVGVDSKGHWIFLVVDGKQSFSKGLTMTELAQLMFELGAVQALNLDGGGSSILVLEEEVKNQPFGDDDEGKGKKMVRAVSDAILVLPRN